MDGYGSWVKGWMVGDGVGVQRGRQHGEGRRGRQPGARAVHGGSPCRAGDGRDTFALPVRLAQI